MDTLAVRNQEQDDEIRRLREEASHHRQQVRQYQSRQAKISTSSMEQLMKVNSSLLSLEERSTLENLRFNYNASSQVMGMFQKCQLSNSQ